MKIASLQQELQQNSYPGRGIVLGRSEDGAYAVFAYFIMGRSENSRNRVFVEDGAGIRTQAFDPSKMVDPSLIIYAPVRVLGDYTIVTNGDQTDTVYDLMQAGKTFEESLRTREFEPDAPNYTPRISGLIDQSNNGFSYALSILKTAILPPARDIHSPILIPLPALDISFTPMRVMEIRCRAFPANRRKLRFPVTSMRSQKCCGTA